MGLQTGLDIRPTEKAFQAACYLVCLFTWFFWLGWCWLEQPYVIDEVVFAQMAHTPFAPFGHPPAYIHALSLLTLAFGRMAPGYRILGLGALVVTACISYRLAQRLEKGSGWWAVWLLCTSPLAVRSAFVLDIDNTLLTVWVVASIWLLAQSRWPLTRQALLGLALWWAAGLWMKLTTPWLFLVAVAAAYVYQGLWRRATKDTAFIAVVGGLVFLAAWTLYSGFAHVPWNSIFSGRILAMLMRGAGDQGAVVFTELAERATRIQLWIGIPAVLLWAAATGYWFRHKKQLSFSHAWAAALALGWGILLGYWVIGGVIWSLARYHCPLIPLIAVFGAVTLTRRLRGVSLSAGSILIPVALAFLWSSTVVKDPIYLVNSPLRHAVLFQPSAVQPLLIQLALRQLGLLGFVVVAAILFRRRHPAALSGFGAFLLALGLTAIGSGAGLAAQQSVAAYATSYCYGRPWSTFYAVRRQVLMFHHASPDAKIMAPFDTFQGEIPFDAFLRVFVNEYFAAESRQTFLKTLEDPQLGLCVLDTDFSSAHAVKNIWSDPEVKAVLAKDFIPVKLGTAQGWVRRSMAGSM